MMDVLPQPQYICFWFVEDHFVLYQDETFF